MLNVYVASVKVS